MEKITLKQRMEAIKIRNSHHGITTAKFEHTNEQFAMVKNVLCKVGSTFELYNTGSITRIVFDSGKKRKYGELKSIQGLHIPKLTNKIVKQRLDSGLYVPKNTDPKRFNSNTIMYSSDRISTNLFERCVSVDVIGCYWQTALNLGVIDQKTYDVGISKDREYKDARNIAIGSIGSLTLYQKYVDGKLVFQELQRKFGACARLDIVDHVWEMAQRVAGKLGPDFLMFLTDCFFVPENREKDVIEYLKQEGYKTKSERVVFCSAEKMNSGVNKNSQTFFTEEIIWKVIDKDKFKFHDFSNKHNYNFK